MAFEDRLPTLDKLGARAPEGIDATKVASHWLSSFSEGIESGNIGKIVELFVHDALWRDVLALTWDFRTFDGRHNIQQLLCDRLHTVQVCSVQLQGSATLLPQFPDLSWIVAMFNFATKVAHCSGVVRLVLTSTGEWRAHHIFTNMENLKKFPEKIASSRLIKPVSSVIWASTRFQESFFEQSSPSVLVIGAGHAGLEVAARLKYLDVPTLVVDRHPRVGDSWRNRYDALCLHWPVWFDHMPYIPFPPTWPRYTSALKMAEWLESYAKLLDLNVWTHADVKRAIQNADGGWTVNIELAGRHLRSLTVNHIVFATGIGDGTPKMPVLAEQHAFKGEILHGTQYKRGSDFTGKRVIVIGTGNSGHDISADLYRHGADVTMYQRGPTFVMDLDRNWQSMGGALYSEHSPPTAIADLLFHSTPFKLLIGGMAQRSVKKIVESDHVVLDGLARVGFKTYLGKKDAGVPYLLKTRGGGHNFNVEASQMLIEGKIKLKSDAQIKCLTSNSIEFNDGFHLAADAIICTTGLGDPREYIRRVCGAEIASRCGPVAGMDAEGETPGQFRFLGVERLWYAWGPLSMCRFHSKHLALQIKAAEEGLIDQRYNLPIQLTL